MSSKLPGSAEWLAEHGIDPEVWNERGVKRYERGDTELVKAEFAPWLKKARRKIDGEIDPGLITRIVNQSSGIVIPKTPLPGRPPIPPQIRPDEKVITDPRPTIHFHGPIDGDWPVFPEWAGSAVGKPLPKKLVLSFSPAYAEPHIAKAHGGINVDGVHRHEAEGAKYVLLGDNQRIDLHPRSAQLLPGADLVFFVLEGALKNDAVLSRGAPVFSVPSVTLWSKNELRHVARLLKGKTVVVVPDSDWYENPLVDMQALFVRTELRQLGIETFIAAPPSHEDFDKVGVDDFLGVIGGNLDELEERGREAPDTVESWLGLFRYDVLKRNRRALLGLSLHADSDGRHARPLNAFTRIMGIARNRKELVPVILEQLGDAVTVQGSLETKLYRFRDTKNRRGVEMLDWKDRPEIEVSPEYRARELKSDDFWRKQAYMSLDRRVTALERAENTRIRREADDVVRGLEDLLNDAA